jgi:hypothetical protein
LFRSLRPAVLLVLLAGAAGCGAAAQGQSVAASVNGQDVSMATYHAQFNYKLIQSESSLGVNVCQIKSMKSLCSQVKQGALEDVIQAELVRQYAVSHHLMPSAQEFQREWAIYFKSQFHNRKDVLSAYARHNHITPPDIRRMQRQSVIQQRVMFAVTQHMPLAVPSVKLTRLDLSTAKAARNALAAVHRGVSFDKLIAAQNTARKSLCAREGGCGTLGWLPLAFVPPGDKAVFTAKPGSIVGPFAGQQVQELLRIDNRSSHYPMTAAQQLRMRQQLFVKWLATYQKHQHITKDVRV